MSTTAGTRVVDDDSLERDRWSLDSAYLIGFAISEDFQAGKLKEDFFASFYLKSIIIPWRRLLCYRLMDTEIFFSTIFLRQ